MFVGKGKPYLSSESNFELEFWKKILQSRQLGYLMTCLCFNEKIKLETFNSVGLLHTHIYSILDVREFENSGLPIRLLKLRVRNYLFIYFRGLSIFLFMIRSQTIWFGPRWVLDYEFNSILIGKKSTNAQYF